MSAHNIAGPVIGVSIILALALVTCGSAYLLGGFLFLGVVAVFGMILLAIASDVEENM